jgi:hypothetical protein
MNGDVRYAGIPPYFPGVLGRWQWLNEWIPAERVAALRIVTGVALVVDILVGYVPHLDTLFSAEALGGRDQFAHQFRDGHFYWSILRWLPESWGPTALLMAWLGSAIALIIGWRPLLAGLVAWACAVSFFNINVWINNSGDRLRVTLCLMVAASCSGAVWGIGSVRRTGESRPVLVPGWPVKVLLVQLAVLYFFSGLYKVASEQWRSGYVMYYAAHDLAWSLAPAQSSKLPIWVHQLSTWITLAWELGFPILVAMRGTRAATLWLGVIFHLATFVTLEVGAFAIYSIVYYVAFLPWERLRWTSRRSAQARAAPATASERANS